MVRESFILFFSFFFFLAWVPFITLKIVFHNLLKKRYSRTIIGPSYQITRIHWKQPRDRASHRLIFYEESRKQKNFLLCESRKIKIILRKSIFWYICRLNCQVFFVSLTQPIILCNFKKCVHPNLKPHCIYKRK